MKKQLILGGSVMLLLIACSKSGSDSGGGGNTGGGGGSTLDCASVPKSFSANVLPIVSSVCSQSGCHNTGSPNGPGQLTNYTEVYNARVQIRSAVASGIMPKNTTLTTAQKNAFLCWIDSGAPNN